MEKKQLSLFNKQLSRTYSLGIAHIILSIIGIGLNYHSLNDYFLYSAIFSLNVIGLFCFEPWKIMGYLNEGYGYQQALEAKNDVCYRKRAGDIQQLAQVRSEQGT